MIRLLFLLLFCITALSITAQNDSVIQKNNAGIKMNDSVRLTKYHQEWINSNFKKIGAMKKDSASKLISKKFGSLPDASIEFMISLAQRLLQEDNQEQLVQLTQALDQLKEQKQSLLKQIQEKEDALAKEKDADKRKALSAAILELQKKMRATEVSILVKERAIRDLTD